MHGEAKLLLKFLDGSDNRYIIPVYQRNYDWRPKQCEQLFNDLVQIIKKDRKTHFFNTVVLTNEKASCYTIKFDSLSTERSIQFAAKLEKE